ncbi:sigma-70 family RNA polymerase sigma factor [Achromobacter seleniivolatilans]|uniref:Sigma-70 family RNA polymerase sigma factor n=1 Tax=Achromobacter seleniivolatilans TaxID=3047478 RepID=A0ABY9MA46_9BURK|nr:sigma-70 family RNA polymerase sigma factor [Achromobacter sp. R39]WMD23595.1 sigma-70 family RNA polymerase sigma factor [Achromobacter sp. R39]
MSSPLLSAAAPCTDASLAPVDGLYRDHRPWLFGWLRRKLGCEHRAEDLAQDVFVRVIQGRKSVRVNEARALLTTIAKGLVVDHQRHAALEYAYLAYLAAMPETYAPSPETQAEQLQALMQLDRLLDGLPPKARSAFLLSQLDGLTYPEIAERLGVSLSSVQQYMVRAMSACYAAFYE